MATKNLGFLVCLLIMALDVTAGILGIEAEIAENKASYKFNWKFYFGIWVCIVMVTLIIFGWTGETCTGVDFWV